MSHTISSHKETVMRNLVRIFPILVFSLILLLGVGGRQNLPPQLINYLEEHPEQAEQLLSLFESQLGNGGWLAKAVLPGEPESGGLPDLLIRDSGTGIVFAHVADGPISAQRFFQTTLVLMNQTRHNTNGEIEFFDDSGNPLDITLDGVTASVLPFSIGPSQTQRFQTSGLGDQGQIRVGWAHVHSEQPISGTATFGIRDSEGRVYTDVGIPESLPGKEFMVFADMVGTTRTGLAVANPSDEPVEVRIDLYDNSASEPKATAPVRTVAPGGHFALFLDELFAGVPGINEFEGTALLSSDTEFTGITLRSTGDQLTSMPMVTPPREGTSWTKIAFPHVGDGTVGDLQILTTVILMNNTQSPASGTVQFFNSDGTEMEVSSESVFRSAFDFALNPRGSARFVTTGEAGLRTGWAAVSMDQPITGTALFSLYKSATLDTEVGVGWTALSKKFSIVGDSLELFNTGLALTHPLSSDYGPTTVTLELFDSRNAWKGRTQVVLEPLNHSAQFMDELFPDIEGIQEFDGRMDVSSSQFIAALCLRQAGTKLTSMPTFSKYLGFAPVSTLDFAQNLAESSPSIQWTLQQNANDFSLEHLRLEAPDLQLLDESFGIGDRIGLGYYVGGTSSRVYEILVRDKGSLEFELIATGDDGTYPLGTGVLSDGDSGGLVMDLTLLDQRPFTYIGSTFALEFQMIPGLVESPPEGGTYPVTTTFTSVSTDSTREARLIRETTQNLTFLPQDPARANLLSVLPVFLEPGGTAYFDGNQFGPEPTVDFTFEILNDDTFARELITLPIPAAEYPDGRWTAQVPFVFSSEPAAGFVKLQDLRVDNGEGPGNSYAGLSLFAPGFRFLAASLEGGAATPFSFIFDQPERMLGISGFQVAVYEIDCDFSGFTAGQTLGSGKFDSDEYDLLVRSVDGDTLIADVIEEGFTDPFATLTLERFEGDGVVPDLGLRLELVEPPTAPVIVRNRTRLEFDLAELPIVLPAAGETFRAVGVAVSTPMLADPETVESVQHIQTFVTEGGG